MSTHDDHASADAPARPPTRDSHRDPVCGMTVNPATAKHSHSHHGEMIYFCSASCRQKFVADPDAFLKPAPEKKDSSATCCHGSHAAPAGKTAPAARSKASSASASPNDATIYTCPMHPEVEQDHPGDCPKCGMALEPRDVQAGDDAAGDQELRDMTRRFIVAAALSLPLLLIAMGPMVGIDLAAALPTGWSGPLQAALSTPVVLWAGWPFAVRGWQSIVNRHLNMFTLIAIGAGTAWVFSMVAVLLPGLFPASVATHGGAVPLYFEAAAVIIALVLLGQVLELRARRRTGDALRALLQLAPETAHVLRGGDDDDAKADTETDIPVADVQVGDRLRVKPGERVPVDGVVLNGHSSVDEAFITGEAMPVEKGEGDPVRAGASNQTGSFTMRVEQVGSDTVLARIVGMVGAAQRSRAPIQRVADTVAGYFVPTVLLVAVVTFAVWAAVGPEPRLIHALVNAVAVLIIACPCALGLATPMSIMVGVGRGARAGILVKDAERLEALHRIDTLVIDKTGTLTEGQPRLDACLPADNREADDLLALVAGLETRSEHPLAKALIAAAREKNLQLPEVETFEAHVGGGIVGRVDGHDVRVGKPDFLAEAGIKLPGDLAERAAHRRNRGQTIIAVAVDGDAAGLLAIHDPVKMSARPAIEWLQGHGIKVVMLTGDHERTAQSVAGELGIRDVHAGLSPADKLEIVKRLRADGRRVAMAGDGINDAPALATADVGIAMGTGADVAIESAGITLLQGDLASLVAAIRLSRLVMRNIRQNLFFAFAYNTIGIPIAAGILYPVFGVLLSPMIAAAAMSLSSVSVIANALRLRHADLELDAAEVQRSTEDKPVTP